MRADREDLLLGQKRSSTADMKMSEEQQIIVGSALQSKQTEWSELLQYDEIEVFDMPENNIRDIPLRCRVAALYYSDAVHGRNVEFPQSPLEITCYRISRSHRFLNLYGLVTLLDMILPFLTRPFCAWTSGQDYGEDVDHYDSSDESNYLSRKSIINIKILCLVFYWFEVVVRYFPGHSVRRAMGHSTDKWLLFRVFVCCVLTVEYIVFQGRASVLTLSKAFVPFLYISRRHSLRQIVEGVGFAAVRCADVFMLLLLLILLWSFVGYLLFHGLNVNEDGESYSKFDNFSESFYMCLQTFATRRFLLFVLKPYYEVNPVSALFFVSLTIVTDILCTALIIATGNRQYRVHANNVFAKKLKSRKQAVLAAFQLLCHMPQDEESNDGVEKVSSITNGYKTLDLNYLKTCSLTRDKWLVFCKSIPTTPVKLSTAKIHILFNLETHLRSDGCIGLESFFRLCGTLNARYFIGLNQAAARSLELQQLCQEIRERSDSTSDESRQSSLLSISFSSSTSPYNTSMRMNSRERSDTFVTEHSRFSTRSTDSQSTSRRRSTRSIDSMASVKSRRTSSRRSSVIQTQNVKEQLMREQARRHSVQDAEVKEKADEHANSGTDSVNFRKEIGQKLYHIIKIIQLLLRAFVAFNVTVTTFLGKVRVNVFDTIIVTMRLLLLRTLTEVTRNESSVGWYAIWWVLEVYFWGEMMFLLLACGWKQYIKERGLGIPIVVNIMSLTLMSMLRKNDSRSGTVFILTVLTQSIRLPSLIMQYKAASAFNSITPLVFRVIFITFAVIYFYRFVV